MKKSKLPVEEFSKLYSTVLKVLTALLHFRKSEDGHCFNKYCPGKIKEHYRPIRNRKGFLCRICLGHFYPMSASIMDYSKIDPVYWFKIIYLMLASRNGIAALEVSRIFGIHPPAIFRMMHLIREQMGRCLDFTFENTVVEIDESYINTGTKGLGRHYPFKRGRGSERKTNILAITERGGRAKLFVIPTTEANSIVPLIIEQVKDSCLIITDEWGAYEMLKDLGYSHVVCNHSDKKGKYKQGSASTNSNEGLFSSIKRGVKGSFRSISNKYLQNYLNEFAFRYTFRDEEDYGFEKLIMSFGDLSEHYKDKFPEIKFPNRAA